jgi:endonuclease III related protein
MMTIKHLYTELFDAYGPQGWWPLISKAGVDGRDLRGYLPGFFGIPEPEAAFEIALGAILTQNTSWLNAERAVKKLMDMRLTSPNEILSIQTERLSELIRPAGYYNMKTKKLKMLAAFFQSLESSGRKYRSPAREKLLDVWGIGPETADSILLYAFGYPSFVIDAYTRRIVGRLGILSEDLPYDKIQQAFETELTNDVSVFNEFHALLVEHSKRNCRSKPNCSSCCLKKHCNWMKNNTI